MGHQRCGLSPDHAARPEGSTDGSALRLLESGSTIGDEALYCRQEDVTLGNPFGGFAHGWDEVVEQLERAASHYRDGGTIGFETVSQLVLSDFAYTVEIERFNAKVGGADEPSDLALRVTCVYRRENDAWRLVHRHADPRVSRQPAESVIQRESTRRCGCPPGAVYGAGPRRSLRARLVDPGLLRCAALGAPARSGGHVRGRRRGRLRGARPRHPMDLLTPRAGRVRHRTKAGRHSERAPPAGWGAEPASGVVSRYLISYTRSVNFQPSEVRW
jgi:ketosteroid isomerase-like protein